jgi:hypothetical protein
MGVFGRLVIGIVGLLLAAFMTAMFGIGGLFFTLGLFVVIVWAFSAGS